MSNTLEKIFVTTLTLVPGYTVANWHPPYSYVVTSYYDTTELATTPEVIPNGASFAYGPHDVVIWMGDHYVVYRARVITHTVNTVIDIPGYWSYDVQPDTYAISYGHNPGWNAAARSLFSIGGNGYATFSISTSNAGSVVGLNELNDSAGAGYFEISYGIFCSGGYYNVIEQGAAKTAKAAYLASDVFKIDRTAGVVTYYLNNTLVYTSSRNSADELLLDCSLYAAGDTISNAALIDTSSPQTASGELVSPSTIEHNGIYYSDGDVVDTGVVLRSTSSIDCNAVFATGNLTALSTIKATGPTPRYAGVSATFKPLTSSARSSRIRTNNATVMVFSALTGLAADYKIAGVKSLFPALTGSSQAAQGEGNSGHLRSLGWKLWGLGHSEALNAGELLAYGWSLSGSGGAKGRLIANDWVIAGTGTQQNLGHGKLINTGWTLTAAGQRDYNGHGALVSHGWMANGQGGAKGALAAHGWALSATGLGFENNNGKLITTGWSLSGAGLRWQSGQGALVAPGWKLGATGHGSLLASGWTLTAKGGTLPGNAIAYCMNLHTNESFEWSNMAFLHIIRIGTDFYGVKSTGLYKLSSSYTTDASTAINANILTKETDFGTYKSKRLQYAYLGSDSPTVITPIFDGVIKQSHASAFGGRKTKMSLKNSGRYVQLQISGIKELTGLELLPQELQRRVK